MNKKISSLLVLLVLLLSIIFVYANLSQQTIDDADAPDFTEPIDEDTLFNEINSMFLEEDGGIEIGEMI